jgi:Leucine-rich repeat (LRR) protein
MRRPYAICIVLYITLCILAIAVSAAAPTSVDLRGARIIAVVPIAATPLHSAHFEVQWTAPTSSDRTNELSLQYTLWAEWGDVTVRVCGPLRFAAEGALQCSFEASKLSAAAAAAAPVSLRLLTECNRQVALPDEFECLSALSPLWPLSTATAHNAASIRIPSLPPPQSPLLRRAPTPPPPPPPPLQPHARTMKLPRRSPHPLTDYSDVPSPPPSKRIVRVPRVHSPEQPALRAKTASGPTFTDDELVAALRRFYNTTSGTMWQNSTGWDGSNAQFASLPPCAWFGITCEEDEDESGSSSSTSSSSRMIVGLQLGFNGLSLRDTDHGDINFVWNYLPALQRLDLSANMSNHASHHMGNLTLRSLTQLRYLDLTAWDQPHTDILGDFLDEDPRPPPKLLELPEENSMLLSINISNCGLWINLSQTPQLEELQMGQNYATFELADIWWTPHLQILSAADSQLTSSNQTAAPIVPALAQTLSLPLPFNLTGGFLTQFVLSHLHVTNPALTLLDVSSTPLPFADQSHLSPWSGAVTWIDDNFPHIVSQSLQHLVLSSLPQLHTSHHGPEERWMADMPALEWLALNNLPSAVFNTSALYHAGKNFQVLDAASITYVGDLTPLRSVAKLTYWRGFNTGVRSTLPLNVSHYWPNLESFSAQSCNLYGTLPSFANLPHFVFLALGNNQFDSLSDDDGGASGTAVTVGGGGRNFLVGSPNVRQVFLHDNNIRADQLTFTLQDVAQALTQLVIRGNLMSVEGGENSVTIDSALALASHRSHGAVCVCVCSLRSGGKLPAWKLPVLESLDVSNNLFLHMDLSSFSFPSLLAVDLSDNGIDNTEMPANLWELLPSVMQIDFSNMDLRGNVPESNYLRPFHFVSFSGNQLTGHVPKNVSAQPRAPLTHRFPATDKTGRNELMDVPFTLCMRGHLSLCSAVCDQTGPV